MQLTTKPDTFWAVFGVDGSYQMGSIHREAAEQWASRSGGEVRELCISATLAAGDFRRTAAAWFRAARCAEPSSTI